MRPCSSFSKRHSFIHFKVPIMPSAQTFFLPVEKKKPNKSKSETQDLFHQKLYSKTNVKYVGSVNAPFPSQVEKVNRLEQNNSSVYFIATEKVGNKNLQDNSRKEKLALVVLLVEAILSSVCSIQTGHFTQISPYFSGIEKHVQRLRNKYESRPYGLRYKGTVGIKNQMFQLMRHPRHRDFHDHLSPFVK